MNIEELNMNLVEGGNSRSANKQELKHLSLSPQFTEIDDPDTFLFQKGVSWVEKGGKLVDVRMNKINNLRFDDFQKGGSWMEKGATKERQIIIISIFPFGEIWCLGDLMAMTKQSETVEPLRGSDLVFAFHLRLHRWLLKLKSFGLSNFINPDKGLI